MVIGVWIAAVVFALFYFAYPAMSQQHDTSDAAHWYEIECCDTQDCAPMRAGQTVQMTPDGIRFRSPGHGIDTLVTWGDPRLRPSRDGDWHPCIIEGDQVNDSFLRCLYAPGVA